MLTHQAETTQARHVGPPGAVSSKRGQLMLTHLDSLRRTPQARHFGPPGEVPHFIAQLG